MKAIESVLPEATFEASTLPVAFRCPYPRYLLSIHRLVKIKGVVCHQFFPALAFRMWCNGGGFINVLVIEVLWIFLFGNIIKETVF